MNKRQYNKMAMYDVVILECDKNIALISTIIVLLGRYNDYKGRVAALKTLMAEGVLSLKGASVGKKEYRILLARTGSDYAAIIRSYADDTHNYELLEKMQISETNILYDRDEKVVPYCIDIYNAGITNLAALTPYNITGTMLADFSASITAYEMLNQKPGLVRVERKTLNANIDQTMTEIDDILNKHIDNQMRSFRLAQPDFFTNFTNARVIVDLHGASKRKTNEILYGAFGCFILDAETSLPVEGATLLFVESGQIDESDEDGDTYIEQVKFGKYTIQVAAPGYETLVMKDYDINTEDVIEETLFIKALTAQPEQNV